MIDYSGVDTEFLVGWDIMVLEACSGEFFFVAMLGCFCYFKDRSNHQKG